MIELFILGLTTSYSSCFAFCSPHILAYIAGTQKNWKHGLKSAVIFLSTKLFIYIIIGLLAGIFGKIFFFKLNKFHNTILIISGGIIFLIGIAMLFKPDSKCAHFCDNVKAPILLGLTIPCLPIFAIFTYIATISKNVINGALLGLSYGLGIFLSPIIPLSIVVSLVPQKIIPRPLVSGQNIFKIVGGCILILIGSILIIRGLF